MAPDYEVCVRDTWSLPAAYLPFTLPIDPTFALGELPSHSHPVQLSDPGVQHVL